MITVEKTSEFYKNPSLYVGADEIVAIKDAKTKSIKSLLIPEALVKKYRFLYDEEFEESLLNSFKSPMPKEIQESFGDRL
jgi:hypothetical protein